LVATGPSGLLASNQLIGCRSLTINDCSDSFCENFRRAVIEIRRVNPRWVSFHSDPLKPVDRQIKESDIAEQNGIALFVVNKSCDATVQSPFYRYNEDWQKQLVNTFHVQNPSIRQHFPDPTAEDEVRRADFPPLSAITKADGDGHYAVIESSARIAIFMLAEQGFERLWRDAAGVGDDLEVSVEVYRITDDDLKVCKFNGSKAESIEPVKQRADQRIEGRWKCSVATEGPDFITFRPDGVARMEFSTGERIDTKWRKEGSDLVFDLRGREKRSPVRFVNADRLEVGVAGKAGYTVLERTEE
jgi:hypothetical protein